MENRAKISLVESFFLVIMAIIADLINWIPGINWLVAIIMFPVTQFYFRLKGVKGLYSLAANLAELIPFISILPAYTAGIIITIWIANHPRSVLARKTQEAARVLPVGQKVKRPQGKPIISPKEKPSPALAEFERKVEAGTTMAPYAGVDTIKRAA